MGVLRFEMKRAFKNRWLYLSIGIGSVIGVLDLLLFWNTYETDGSVSLTQAWLGTNYQFAYNTLYYILLPIIASMPYAGSCFTDIHSGYDKNILIKVSRGAYIRAKLLAVFASAFVAVVTPLILDLFLAAGLYPDNKPERLSFMVAGIIDSQLFPKVYGTHPVLYSLLFTVLDGLFGGLLGIMSVCICKWVKGYFTAIMIPFVIYVTGGELLAENYDGTWSLMLMINPVQSGNITYLYQLALLYSVMMVLCLITVYLNWKRRDVL